MYSTTHNDNDYVSDASSATGSADEWSDAEVPLIEKLLPGHKIARGRGRRKQLEQMTEQEKAAEKESRMEKMRISARECRKRKKAGIKGLEAKLQKFAQKDKRSAATISRLEDEMRILRERLAAASASASPSPSPPNNACYHTAPQQQQQRLSVVTTTMDRQLPQQMQYDTIFEDCPHETLASVSSAASSAPATPPSLYEKRRPGAIAPTKLDLGFAAAPQLEMTACFRLTPLTPLTPGIKLADLVPGFNDGGFTLPTPEPCQVGGMAFAFNCIDAEVALLV